MMNRLHRFAATALFIMVSIASAAAARADSLLVGNLANTPGGSDTIGPDGTLAQSFTVGGMDWKVSSIEAALGGLGNGTFAASATLVASTTNATGDRVPNLATVVANFTFPAVGTGFSTLNFMPTSSLVLSANTQYWFVLQATSAGAAPFDWQFTTDAAVDPDSKGALAASASTVPGSGVWNLRTDARYLIEVNGDPVATVIPEPSSWIMAGLGASCMFALVRRRTETAA